MPRPSAATKDLVRARTEAFHEALRGVRVRLQDAGEEARATATKLSEATGIDRSVLSRILTAARSPTVEQVALIARALEAPDLLDAVRSAELGPAAPRSAPSAPAPVPPASTLSPARMSDPDASVPSTVDAYVAAHRDDLTPREVRFLERMRTKRTGPLTDAMLDGIVRAYRESLD